MTLASVVTDKRTIKFFATLENKLNMLHAGKYDYSKTIYQSKRLNFSYLLEKKIIQATLCFINGKMCYGK
jgi:hypothetical protein